jgi:DNA polymerase
VDPRIARYLRQLGELGAPDLYLENVNRDEALVWAAGVHSRRPAGGHEAAKAELAGVDEVVTAPGAVAAPASLRIAPAPSPEQAETLRALGAEAAVCTRCRLHETRRTVVFGVGNEAAELVVVGEAPGQEEDRTGKPFVGRAGRLLDLLLMSVGFPREQVYICNVLKCRPPGNRDPLPDEMDPCTRNFLFAQLDVIAPRVLLAVGRIATQALLQTAEPIGRLRGRLHAWRGTPLVISYHPAYLLRSPNMVRSAWNDFQLVRTVLDEQS